MSDILEEPPYSNSISLPPIFGGYKKKHKKKGKRKKNSNLQCLKILYDTELRSKASSVLHSMPPKFLKSIYKTSRLTQLSTNFIRNLKDNNLRSNANFPSVASIHHPVNLSYDNSRFLRDSKLQLPSINRTTLMSLEEKNDGNGLYLSGNKKEILGRNDYYKYTEDGKKKVHKEIALGTDLCTEGSDKMSTGNDTINEFLKPHDKINMRKSSFTFNYE